MYDIDPRRQQRLRVIFATALGGAAIGVIVVAFALSSFPSPFWLWAIFAAAFVALEWNAVEVNDRLFASPTVMVLMTAAVIFGADTAVLGVALMAATGMLTADDVRERRWFQPIANGGQFVISAAASATVLVVLLPDDLTLNTLWQASQSRRHLPP